MHFSCLPCELVIHYRSLLNGGASDFNSHLVWDSSFLSCSPLKLSPKPTRNWHIFQAKPNSHYFNFGELYFPFLSMIICLTSFFLTHAMKKDFSHILSFIFICVMLEGISLHIGGMYSGKQNSSYLSNLPVQFLPYSAWSSSILIFISHSSCLHRFHTQEMFNEGNYCWMVKENMLFLFSRWITLPAKD